MHFGFSEQSRMNKMERKPHGIFVNIFFDKKLVDLIYKHSLFQFTNNPINGGYQDIA